MSMLYEKVYRQMREKFEHDGDLRAFNAFIAKAHEFQFGIATKKISETKFSEWLNAQLS